MADWAPFPAFEGEQGSKDKNGIETVNVPFYVPTRAMARFWLPDDLEKEFGLPVTRRSYQQEWGNGRLITAGRDGAFKVNFTLEGVDPNDKDYDEEQGVQFDCDGTVAEEAVEAHPNLPFLMDKYQGEVEDDKVVWPPELDPISIPGLPAVPDSSRSSATGTNRSKNPLFGFKKWQTSGVIWTRTCVTLRPRPSVTKMLNRIDKPPKAPDGYLPDLPGKRNWLKIVGKVSFRGNIWKVTESWEMSDDGGWNEDVYR